MTEQNFYPYGESQGVAHPSIEAVVDSLTPKTDPVSTMETVAKLIGESLDVFPGWMVYVENTGGGVMCLCFDKDGVDDPTARILVGDASGDLGWSDDDGTGGDVLTSGGSLVDWSFDPLTIAGAVIVTLGPVVDRVDEALSVPTPVTVADVLAVVVEYDRLVRLNDSLSLVAAADAIPNEIAYELAAVADDLGCGWADSDTPTTWALLVRMAAGYQDSVRTELGRMSTLDTPTFAPLPVVF